MSSPWQHCIDHLKADYKSCSGRDDFSLSFLFHPGFQVCSLHRFSHYFYIKGWVPLAKLMVAWMRWTTGCDIHYNTDIGPGVQFPHGRGVIVGEGTRIAKRCSLFQHVTCGAMEGKVGAPTLEEGVNLYPGTVIVGPITLGEYCRIGPNVYLTESLPSHTRAKPPSPDLTRRNPS
jgi:serine O-acetyltransferase